MSLFLSRSVIRNTILQNKNNYNLLNIYNYSIEPEPLVIEAKLRWKVGKKSNLEHRIKGWVPAVLHMGNKQDIFLTMHRGIINSQMEREGFTPFNYLLKFENPNGIVEEHLVTPTELEVHPISEKPWHVVFDRVNK
eukprot:TRINITY_DN381_c1_g1_i1.p1 TRINITY_DN381_c1_g1~~TRINITY_DN381_c1_g1_i1.p1  ORF type:complete len:136 (-),score=25.19 TRINITY_DN381_c1_g1_i1:34-441(-)